MQDILTESESKAAAQKLQNLKGKLESVIFGQSAVIEKLLVGVLARGHVLLEGLPGLGKTELAKALAQSLSLDVRRIQFTPDLLPGDVTGSPILEESPSGKKFVFHRGPLFANLVLADEINRASPKTQAALLEAMQERRVTVMGESHELPQPFFVLATQNPIELEGTYPLPEAQLDRFLFKVEVLRNQQSTLEKIVKEKPLGDSRKLEAVLSREELMQLMAQVSRVFLPDVVATFIAQLVNATHPGESQASAAVKFGASPRAAIALASAARARALMHGRINTSFEDVEYVAEAVLAHRVILSYSGRLQGLTSAAVVKQLLTELAARGSRLPSTLEQTSA